MIFQKATKFKILEWTIDAIFNGIEKNFRKPIEIRITDLKTGMKLSEIRVDYTNLERIEYSKIKDNLTNCEILEITKGYGDYDYAIFFNHDKMRRGTLTAARLFIHEFDECFTFIL